MVDMKPPKIGKYYKITDTRQTKQVIPGVYQCITSFVLDELGGPRPLKGENMHDTVLVRYVQFAKPIAGERMTYFGVVVEELRNGTVTLEEIPRSEVHWWV